MAPSAESRGSLNRCSPSTMALGVAGDAIGRDRAARAAATARAGRSPSPRRPTMAAAPARAGGRRQAPASTAPSSQRSHFRTNSWVSRSLSSPARTSMASFPAAGHVEHHAFDAIAAVAQGHDGRPVVHAVLVLRHLGVDRHQLGRLAVLGADVEQQRERLADLDAHRIGPEGHHVVARRRSRCRCRARDRAGNPPRPERRSAAQ